MKRLNLEVSAVLRVAILAVTGLAPLVAEGHEFAQQSRFYGPMGFGYPGARFSHGGVHECPEGILPFSWQPVPWSVSKRLHSNDATYPPDALVIQVQAPPGTRLFINGRESYLTGSMRTYMSRGLHPYQEFTYEMRAELEYNGHLYTETKTIRGEAGFVIPVVFTFHRSMYGDHYSTPAEDVQPVLPAPMTGEVTEL